jgi:uncharacterized membrane protein YphA (DoxX/SURF4 family)/peroxiredoxin
VAADYGVWIARLLLCVVFGLSAWGKFTDRSGARKALAEFGVPARYVGVVAWALPLLEAALALGLLPSVMAPWAGLAGLLLLSVFTAAVVLLLGLGRRPACSCFGLASEDPIGGATIARNAALMVVAVVVVWGGLRRPQVPGTLPTDHTIGLAVVAIIAAMLVWLIGQVRMLRRQVDRQALSTLGAEGMPAGSVAPEFELADSHGGTTGLQQLLARGTSVVLVFVHPGCDICAILAGELPRWQHRLRDRLTIALIANGDVTENLAWGRERGIGKIPMLVQQGNEVALRYRVRGTPSAVLVDADGRIVAPVARGPIAIRELFVSARTTTRAEGSRLPHPTGR